MTGDETFFVCVQAYDDQKVCYALLAQRILAALPQTDDGVWLMKSTEYGSDTFAQVWMLTVLCLCTTSCKPLKVINTYCRRAAYIIIDSTALQTTSYMVDVHACHL